MGVSVRPALGAGLAAIVVALAACGGDDDDGGAEDTIKQVSAGGITESDLPAGFSKTPAVELEGKRWKFDNVPGHYWKVLDNGYAVALHFQTDKPFKWAKDVPKGELLYMVYAIPGNCGDGNFQKAVKAPDATVQGPTPPGFDHWHGLVGAGPKLGHWLMHIPVRDFTFEGMPDNPMDGTAVKAANPGFMPVCDIR